MHTLSSDGLGYSGTVPVTFMHRILRHMGASIMYGRSWIFRDCLSNFWYKGYLCVEDPVYSRTATLHRILSHRGAYSKDRGSKTVVVPALCVDNLGYCMNHPVAKGHSTYRSGLLRQSWLMLGLSTGPLDYPDIMIGAFLGKTLASGKASFRAGRYALA